MSGMAFSDLNSSPSITIERLPAGLPSYYRTLDAMAQYVRQAGLNYSLKLFLNRWLLSSGIAGHDFTGEVASLFFSFGIASAMRAIRWMWSWCKTRNALLKPARAIVTTKWLRCVRCFVWPGFLRASCVAARRARLWITSGAKSIWNKPMSGCRSIPLTNALRRAGLRLSPGV